MNYRSILLSGVALGILIVAVLAINTEKKENDYYTKAKLKESEREKAKAQGAAEYFHMMRANPATGKIDPNDVLLAEQQLRELNKTSYKTTGLNPLKWEGRGPDNIGGRTRAVICDKDDPNKMYMGMVSGGFWSSPDRGNSWVKMAGNDSIMRMSVSCVTQAANGDVYYGTGETFTGGGSLVATLGFQGNGVYKSTDRGASVTHLTSTGAPYNATNGTWSYVNKIKAHPTDANTVIAATDRGLRRTTDGGNTWSLIGLGQAPMVDLDISSSGNVILASSFNQVFLSTDGGTSFTGINSTANGLPGAGGVIRVGVAIAPSDENVMYIVMSQSGGTRGIYKSTDKGTSWVTIGNGGSQAFNPIGDQGRYNMAFGVHPTDPGVVFVGGQLELWRYTSQTATWDNIAFWLQSPSSGLYVHADMHGIQFNTSNPDEMYVITDGGFFRTNDCKAANPFFVEKNKDYATYQCYGLAANNEGSIITGAQDNGTNIMDGSIANSPNHARTQMGGDGMRGAASDINYNFLFGTSQNGNLRRSSNGGSSVASYIPIWDANIDTDGDDEIDDEEGGPWVTPVELKENHNGTATKSVLLVGLNNHVWFTQNAVSNDRVIWFPLFKRNGSGFSSIEVSKDGKEAYVGDRSGRLTRITGIDLFGTKYKYDDTTDNLLTNGFAMGNSFVTYAMPNAGFGGSFISDIEISDDASELMVTTPHYGQSIHVWTAFFPSSASPVFTSIQGNLPAMPIYSCAYLSDNTKLVGTEMGIFATDSIANGNWYWEEMNNIPGPESDWHPRVAVTEIDVKPTLDLSTGGYHGDIIYSATYGRGTWRSLSYAQFSPVSVKETTKSNTQLSVYPNPVGDVATINYDANKSSLAGVQVLSLTGRVLRHQEVSLNAGSNKLQIDMSGLSRGVYMIHMNSKNGHVTAKVIKR